MARRLANLGLVLALVLALTPSMMRLAAEWEARRELAAFLDSPAPPAARPPQRRAAAIAVSRHRDVPIRAAHRRTGTPIAMGPSPAVPLAAAPIHPAEPDRQPGNRIHIASAERPAKSPAPAASRRPWEPCLIEIPAIGVRSVVRPGVGNWRMIPGPAWEPASAGPGGPGNAVIAAHRNMWQQTFSRLPRVRAGQPVYIRTHTHRYKYVVTWSRQVSTRDTELLKNTREPRLTLYTCVLPFDPKRRWMVRAELADVWAVAPAPGAGRAREAAGGSPGGRAPAQRT